MVTFCEVFAQAISLLQERAKLAKGEDEQLESFPWVSFEHKSQSISGSFAWCDANKLVLNTYEEETRATKHDYLLSEYFEGDGVVISVKLWMNAWRSRGGYYGETRAEYGGEPDPIGRTAAEIELRRTPEGGWVIVGQE